jgi:hypothetical protein
VAADAPEDPSAVRAVYWAMVREVSTVVIAFAALIVAMHVCGGLL